jgi:hypothetical protein
LLAKDLGFYSLNSAAANPIITPAGVNNITTRPATGQVYAFTPSAAIITAPTASANGINVIPQAKTMNVNWTNGNGAYRYVFIKQTTSTSETVPVTDGETYFSSVVFDEEIMGSGWSTVYNGTGNTVTIEGLQSGLTYRIQVVEYNGLGGVQKYQTTAGANNPLTTATLLVRPLTPVSAIIPLSITGSSINFDLSEGDGIRRAIFLKAVAPDASVTEVAPVADNATYIGNTVFGTGSQVGSSGWYCVFDGNSLSDLTVTGLAGSTRYNVHVVDYNGLPGVEKYSTSTNYNNPATFVTTPVLAYTFAASAGTFVPVSGGTAVDAIEDDDDVSTSIPIGFTFRLSGIPYTSLKASSNGFLSFNELLLELSNNNNNLAEGLARPLIAPLWDDLSGEFGQASYVTTGVSPNRVFTFEWLNWRWNFGQSSPTISFQVKLYEADSKIEYVYRQQAAAPTSPGASIGLAFQLQGEDNFVSLNNSGVSPNASTTVETTTIDLKPATGQIYSFTPVKLDQIITFNPLPAKSFGNAAFLLTGSSTSGLPMSYTSSNPDVATVSGNTVTIVGIGQTTITASQTGDVNFNAAASVPQTLTVVKGNQAIFFSLQNFSKTFGDEAFDLPGFAYTGDLIMTGLPITYTSTNTSVATISGKTVTILAAGTADIIASQTGNDYYNAASEVIRTLTVSKANQTITFDVLASKNFGDASFDLSATASSGLPVTYTSSNPAIATIAGNKVTIIALGTTDITASQAGSTNYNAASDVIQPFSVKTGQTITFEPITTKTLGDPAFTLSATATSGLAVTFTSVSDKVSISGNLVTLVKAGSVAIKANQAGNNTIGVAPAVERTFCINPAKPSINASALDTEAPVLTSSSPTGNQWFKDGVAIEGATNATVTVSSVGTYTVVVTIDNCSGVASDGESLIITGTEATDQGVRIFPNPAENEIVVDVTGLNSPTPVSLAIYDVSGRTMHTMTGNGKMNVKVSSYRTGNYVLKIESGKRIITKQIIKK